MVWQTMTESIPDFISHFTSDSLGNVVKIHKSYYLVDDELLKVKDKINLAPEYIGIFLGEDSKPSLALLELIAKHSDRKVFINDSAEYLFICGRDVFGKSIVKANISQRGKIVLVQNGRDENLGYGEIVDNLDKRDKVVLKNLADRGDFLRREMSKKS